VGREVEERSGEEEGKGEEKRKCKEAKVK